MTFNNDCKELKLRAAPGGKMTMTFDASLNMKSAEKTRKAVEFEGAQLQKTYKLR